MTGRENIVLSGMLLGFSEEEVRAKEEEIVEFAELGEFIDMPVRTSLQWYVFQTGILHYCYPGN